MMKRITIDGKDYSIDMEKCIAQGLLKIELKYPKDWTELSEFDRNCRNWHDVGLNDDSTCNIEETKAFVALGKLIQLRDWWWDNMCEGWRPDWHTIHNKYCFHNNCDNIVASNFTDDAHILAFPSPLIGTKFYETYKDLVKEAKMFL